MTTAIAAAARVISAVIAAAGVTIAITQIIRITSSFTN